MRLRVDLDLRMLLKRSSTYKKARLHRIAIGPRTTAQCALTTVVGFLRRRCSTWPVKSLTSAICSYRRSTVSDACSRKPSDASRYVLQKLSGQNIISSLQMLRELSSRHTLLSRHYFFWAALALSQLGHAGSAQFRCFERSPERRKRTARRRGR